MGMASVIHQQAINTASAAVFQASTVKPPGGGIKSIAVNTTGPAINPAIRRMYGVLPFTSVIYLTLILQNSQERKLHAN